MRPRDDSVLLGDMLDYARRAVAAIAHAHVRTSMTMQFSWVRWSDLSR